jgi:hypothetical protein
MEARSPRLCPCPAGAAIDPASVSGPQGRRGIAPGSYKAPVRAPPVVGASRWDRARDRLPPRRSATAGAGGRRLDRPRADSGVPARTVRAARSGTASRVRRGHATRMPRAPRRPVRRPETARAFARERGSRSPQPRSHRLATRGAPGTWPRSEGRATPRAASVRRLRGSSRGQSPPIGPPQALDKPTQRARPTPKEHRDRD